MEFIREDCIYARQSVDRKDSKSIDIHGQWRNLDGGQPRLE